jgi:hypothetical protein
LSRLTRFSLLLIFQIIVIGDETKQIEHFDYSGLSDFLIDLFLVFNATFSNISAISWRSVLVVEEAGVPGE